MKNRLQAAIALLSPPGDTIQEHIDFIGMSQAELAERMGRRKEKINDIIKGREPISTATAFQLEKVLGISASFWINRENNYRMELYELQHKIELEKEKDWLDAFPIEEMIQLGWIADAKEKHVLVASLLKFFAVASPDEWEKVYVDKEVSVSFRMTLAQTKSPHAISAWLRRGEIQAQAIRVGTFNKKKFRAQLKIIKEFSYLMPENFTQELQKICADAGVSLVYTQSLSKAPISGAARWFHNQPIIQLSDRLKSNDIFWFTFFHEAAHILLHGKKETFLENLACSENELQKEEEANAFAMKMLIDDKDWGNILAALPLNAEKILKISEKIKVAPGIIVARLQYENLVPKSFGNELKVGVYLFAYNHAV
jgi:addiction module HigA family antidote